MGSDPEANICGIEPRKNKLKSLKVAKWRKDEWRMMKDEWRMMKDEGWMINDDNFKLLWGFADWLTDRRTDICECRVAFATEKLKLPVLLAWKLAGFSVPTLMVSISQSWVWWMGHKGLCNKQVWPSMEIGIFLLHTAANCSGYTAI